MANAEEIQNSKLKMQSYNVKFKIMKLKAGIIKELQKYIAYKDKERGFSNETVAQRLLLLTEEVGELIKSCREKIGIGVGKYSNERHIGEELADVIYMAFSTGEQLGLDIEKEFIKKDRNIDKRMKKK